ncbi:MAG TPA: hypothetical protein VEH47_07425 [Candidatus Acidoferrales bacterium]|nr:hypothetical protein [Candidatus Acidoferrales bacterium]
MSNERYLVVSYFFVGLVSLSLGVAAYHLLRRPFAVLAEAVAGKVRSALLKRTLALSIIMAALLGFFSVSYTSCDMTYEQIVKDRDYVMQKNREQLQGAGNWIAYAVLAWGVVVVIGLAALRRREESSGRQRDDR